MKRAVLTVFLGGGAFFGSSMFMTLATRLESPAAAPPQSGGLPAPASDVLKLADRFEAVARQVSPAVVYVEAVQPQAASGGKGRPVEESGSGVIIADFGLRIANSQQSPIRNPKSALGGAEGARGYLVLTNNHVIAQAAPDQITVNLADGRLFHPKRVWADPESDVALLGIEGAGDLPAAVLGNSDQTRVGQWVLAIGSPFGLNQTVTHGIVSARERGQISLGSTIRIKDFLQTDAAINPGSSGGPLLNLDGEVIGINTAIASHNGNHSGVAFSIPINLVKQVVRQLLEKGNVARGYLGVQLAPSFEPADAFRVGLDRVQGALVETVYPETPAAEAGLRAGDVVLQVDGLGVRNENHLINMISAVPAGKRVRLQVWRDRRLQTVEAVVGDWSSAQARFRAGR
jgi:S1-C subfamily serine protease